MLIASMLSSKSPSPSHSDKTARILRVVGGLALGGLALAIALSLGNSKDSHVLHPPQPSKETPSEPGPEVEESASLSTEKADIAGKTHVGKVRSNNQDSFRLQNLPRLGPDYALLVVCDGMGGHAGGEVASGIATDLIATVSSHQDSSEHLAIHESLVEALNRADAAIEQRASKERDLAGMGTTAVACVLTPYGYIHCFLGDSRLYHIRGGEIIYQTKDHSVVRYLVEEGIIKEEEAREHPYRSQLTSSLGGGKEANRLTIEPVWKEGQESYRDWESGDTLVLCSDGLNSELTDQQIARIASQAKSSQEAVDALIEATLLQDARDNVTVVVARPR